MVNKIIGLRQCTVTGGLNVESKVSFPQNANWRIRQQFDFEDFEGWGFFSKLILLQPILILIKTYNKSIIDFLSFQCFGMV